VNYKRFDLVVEAFNRLRLPLKIFGDGRERPRLQSLAGPTVQLVGFQPLAALAKLYAHCQAFINPQEEDFGSTPVESMAAGRPVIAYRRGGALETVIEGVTGTFLEDQSWEELANCVIRFEPEKFDSQKIRQHAE
ncbi:TPA: glycosyl transferase, partial [Candidatus Uhrbacteria bacterium]|nr:glycosyl transferase [Candidatus Uhrbacteria bacterium]